MYKNLKDYILSNISKLSALVVELSKSGNEEELKIALVKLEIFNDINAICSERNKY